MPGTNTVTKYCVLFLNRKKQTVKFEHQERAKAGRRRKTIVLKENNNSKEGVKWSKNE